ncbi:MAG: peptidase E [Bdellovibrionales bacterium]|nr:peptidase E [Bdellovibrionales bacterium]
MNKDRHIVAIGGGGFRLEPDNLLLETYILSLCAIEKPKVGFLPTASADNQEYIEAFHKSFTKLGAIPSHLSLFTPHTKDLKQYIENLDILFVGGGNTKNMLALWREWNLIDPIRNAYDQGTVMAGVSAGSICWFEQGVTDSYGVSLESLECMGILKGSNCPHYDSEVERKPRYHQLLKQGMKPGFAAEDGVALHFKNEVFYQAISNRPDGQAFEVSAEGEKTLNISYLGNQS